jgi:hypothetical protein
MPAESNPPATSGTDDVMSPPQYRPQAALTSAPVAPIPEPEFAGKTSVAPRSLGPIALGPATPVATPTVDQPESEFDRVFDELGALAAPTQSEAVSEPRAEAGPAAPAVPGAIGIAPNRRAVVGAFRIMVAAIILILVGIGATVISPLLTSPGAGEVRTNAIVTSLGSTTSNSCTPIARFAVAGKSYTANSSAAISPCPIGLGESVDVVYSAANPASAARIEVGSSATQYLWLISIVGGLLFVAGFITFIIRAGSFVRGITLLRERRKGEEGPVAAP